MSGGSGKQAGSKVLSQLLAEQYLDRITILAVGIQTDLDSPLAYVDLELPWDLLETYARQTRQPMPPDMERFWKDTGMQTVLSRAQHDGVRSEDLETALSRMRHVDCEVLPYCLGDDTFLVAYLEMPESVANPPVRGSINPYLDATYPRTEELESLLEYGSCASRRH